MLRNFFSFNSLTVYVWSRHLAVFQVSGAHCVHVVWKIHFDDKGKTDTKLCEKLTEGTGCAPSLSNNF